MGIKPLKILSGPGVSELSPLFLELREKITEIINWVNQREKQDQEDEEELSNAF